jgi:hypothetical protein
MSCKASIFAWKSSKLQKYDAEVARALTSRLAAYRWHGAHAYVPRAHGDPHHCRTRPLHTLETPFNEVVDTMQYS